MSKAKAHLAIIVFGGVLGYGLGVYLLSDYQLIKYTPPSPENFDEKGNWKGSSFFKVKYANGTAPLELKPEAKERLLQREITRRVEAGELKGEEAFKVENGVGISEIK